ncbi:interferon-induced protein 44-like [Lycodopsis pacificus]
MGFEENANTGVDVQDVKLAMRGHMPDGYQFNPVAQLQETDRDYISSPTLEDRVHVLVCVIPADSVSLISDKVVKNLREVRLAAAKLGIPQLAILTKVDEACPQAKEDINETYRIKYLKEQVDKFSLLLGIPPNCIFLVKNYQSEIETNDDMNALILTALKQMINFGEDFLDDL